MNQVQSYEEYKLKEFKGDALASFIARELCCVNWKMRQSLSNHAHHMCSNKNFGYVAINIGLIPHELDDFESPVKPQKRYANAYEVKLYDVYLESGYEAAKEFFKDTAYKQYNEYIAKKYGKQIFLAELNFEKVI